MLKHLASRLQEQALEIAALRAALEAQTQRIADLQSELELWPHSPALRRAVRALAVDLSPGNGHHRHHR